MSFRDRLRRLDYVSPNGEIFRDLGFRELQRTGGKKHSIVEYPLQDVPDITDLGELGQKIPMEIYFFGENYDRQIDSFWTALAEPGVGRLTHPRWKRLQVLPVSRSQREDFVSRSRVGVIEVEFLLVESPSLFKLFDKPSFMTKLTDLANKVSLALLDAEDFVLGLEDSFMESSGLRALGEATSTLQATAGYLTDALGGLFSRKSLTANRRFQDAISLLSLLPPNEFHTIASVVVSAVTVLNEDDTPEDELVLGGDATGELPLADTVGSLVSANTGLVLNLPQDIKGASPSPDYVTLDGALVGFFTKLGVIYSLLRVMRSGTLRTRQESVRSMNLLDVMRSDIISDMERIEQAFDYEFPPTILEGLNRVFASAKSLLYFVSSRVSVETSVTLSKDTTLINLCYELYGNLDRLGELESLNTIEGDEFFLIPNGRTIRYVEVRN